VRLTPKSSTDAIDGIARLADGSAVLKARVRAVPESGKANDALVRLIADTLRVAKSAVSVKSGATGRTKTIAITGDAQAIAGRLEQLLGQAET
jgi:uncharacterized protein YggU (UPF0235/DUF167 family)